MFAKGRVAWVFEDNFDVDLIIGIENISTTDISKILDNLMKPYEPDFAQLVKAADILVGGKNFGYGHPHPQSMMGMRAVGIDCIIAESYAFPFYRSELASGMKLFECPGISRAVGRWDEIEVLPAELKVINKTRKQILALKPVPDIPAKIMERGGLLPFLTSEDAAILK